MRDPLTKLSPAHRSAVLALFEQLRQTAHARRTGLPAAARTPSTKTAAPAQAHPPKSPPEEP